jgi:hypothetical protein
MDDVASPTDTVEKASNGRGVKRYKYDSGDKVKNR